jgi:hypothetical protein
VAGIILKRSAVTVTRDIKKTAAPLGVVLHDHVSHTSLRDLKPI